MAVTTYYTVNGEIIGEKTGASARLDYLTDALGNVTATVNQSAQVVNTYRYKPYGALLAKTGAGADPSFQWVGAQGYRQTGKKYSDVYVRARHYDTNTGRWTTKDPINIKLALLKLSATWYQYTPNPVNEVDVSGLSTLADLLCIHGSGANCCFQIYPPGGPMAPPYAEWCPQINDPWCNKCAKGEGFGSVQAYCDAYKDWSKREPTTPWFWELLCLRNQLQAAIDYGKRRCPPGADKCIHCMVSCYLAARCGRNPALWIGWCKEMQDLTDCKPSHFELGDWRADIDGANAASDCLRGCSKYGAR